ncbi:hypothetical protein C1J03_07750 [Sulfitobacter sp. SK012]|uniref:hypothetical protein n=1 Tax=Sulfitobacter sp. SK012 TaxID=1389005 RepID=UPI000E0B874A|nr:hypothetical protein [Sulfitobacter sp. SK012]AXI45925.1 hypothetical protein C1J03_07750 [Sulfitobacter sp. SK012]
MLGSRFSRRLMVSGGVLAAFGLVAGVWQKRRRARVRALYQVSLTKPEGPMAVYHLGHSLVGRDMPAMLAQMAGHEFASQLGWGTPLRDHLDPDLPINGFAEENAHDQFRPAHEAVQSGEYAALILTEMVELRDAIRYHKSADTLAAWAGMGRQAQVDLRVYLYETWHPTDDPKGWLTRIDVDLSELWEGKVALPAADKAGIPVYVIPAGQVLARFVRAVDAAGGVGNVAGRDALFATTEDGTLDTIHLSDLGNYLVACTHYAALYQRSPEGLPLALSKADGTLADAPDADAGALMQKTAWDVVRSYPLSGFSA